MIGECLSRQEKEGGNPYQNGTSAEHIPSLCELLAKVVCGICSAKLSQTVCRRMKMERMSHMVRTYFAYAKIIIVVDRWQSFRKWFAKLSQIQLAKLSHTLGKAFTNSSQSSCIGIYVYVKADT